MKRTKQIIATIISLLILTLFSSPVWAQVWYGDYTIRNESDIAALSGYTEVTGHLIIGSMEEGSAPTTFENLDGLESLTTVGYSLAIGYNDGLTDLRGLKGLTSVAFTLGIVENPALTSLSGLENVISVGFGLWIYRNDALTSLNGLEGITEAEILMIEDNDILTNLCSLYNLSDLNNSLSIYNNTSLSMATAYALETQLRSNGFTGTADIHDNNGTEQVFCDNDKDNVYDDTDNCPNTSNPNQEDVDCDGIGDFCDPDTVYGTISGDVQEGITVYLFAPSCGSQILVDTAITDMDGYYAFGGLNVNSYTIRAIDDDYSFCPWDSIVQIPQPEIQSYDFTAISLFDHDGDGKENYLLGCSNLDGNCDYDDNQYDGNIINVIQDNGTIEELRTYADIDFNAVTPVFHPKRDQTFDYCSNLTWAGNSDWEPLDEHDAWKLASANYTFDTDCASYGSFGCDIFSNSWDPRSTWETPPEPWLSKLNMLQLYNNNWYRNWRLDGCNGREISEDCTSWFTIQESDRYEQNKFETDPRHPDAKPMVICKGSM